VVVVFSLRGPVEPEPNEVGSGAWEWVLGTRWEVGWEESGCWETLDSVVVLSVGLRGWFRLVCWVGWAEEDIVLFWGGG
jgi:hypothetical protein